MRKIWERFCNWNIERLDRRAKKYIREGDLMSYTQCCVAVVRWKRWSRAAR